jgi:predicted TIM-barrel fold metal-dependent hydrolase
MAVECKGVISVTGLQPHDFGQVDRLRSFLDNNPTARLKIEHLGYPDPSEPPPYATYERVMGLSEYKGVYMQLSSPYTHSKTAYPFDDMLPFVEMAKRHFAPYRLIWGSCFPPVEKYMNYAQSLAWLDGLGLKESQKSGAIWDNAVRLMDPRKKKVGGEAA